MKETVKGEISLVFYSFFAAAIGVVIKFLDVYFGIYQQILLRSLVALGLSVLLFRLIYGKFNFSGVTKKDITILFLRSFLHFCAISLWVLAILNTSLANATFVASIPATAIIGVLFFSEKLSKITSLYLGISLLGVAMLSFSSSFEVGHGELYALISTFFFSSASLLRKKISDSVGDREISILSIGITVLYSLLYVIFFQNDFSYFLSNYSYLSVFYIVLGGLLFLLISLSGIYGFKRVSAIKAGSIEYLEIIFAIILGIVFFLEIPTFKDIVGGFLIVLGAYLMMKEKE